MLTIYGRENSSSVQLVMWTIAELGLKHDRKDYGHGYTSTHTPDYLAMNPMGRVPVLQDNDVQMFESAAILRYLSATYGDDAFWPKDPAKRGPLDTWAEWGKNTFTEAVLDIFVYDVRLSANTRDPKILEDATQRLIPLAKILDDQVSDRDWLGGLDFTFADIACGHILYRYFTLDWDRPELPALTSYYERLQTRPAFQKHVMISYEALRGVY